MENVRFLKLLGYIFMVMYPFGAVFKIMHWPFAGILLLAGALCGSISFILYYFLKKDQTFYDRSMIVIIPMICLSLLIRIIPDDFHALAISIAVLVSGSFLVFWATKFVNSDSSFRIQEINWERFFYVVGAVLVFVGVILKYKCLFGAHYFLIGGLVVLAASYIVGFFSKKSLEE